MTRKLVALTVLWLVAGATGRAEAGLLLSGGGSGNAAWNGADNRMMGYSFTVGANDLLVTRLGLLDIDGNEAVNGLNEAHKVGLWDSAGTLLGSVTVPAGTAAPLESGFRFAELDSSVTLAAGQTYILGANYLTSAVEDGFRLDDASGMAALIDSGAATFVDGRRATQSGFGFLDISVINAAIGPNMGFTILSTAVPEPSTLISGGLAGAVGLGLAWRRRRRATVAA